MAVVDVRMGFTAEDRTVTKKLLAYLVLVLVALGLMYRSPFATAGSGNCTDNISWRSVHIAFVTSALAGVVFGARLPTISDVDSNLAGGVFMAILWIGVMMFVWNGTRTPVACQYEPKMKQLRLLMQNNPLRMLLVAVSIICGINMQSDLLRKVNIFGFLARSAVLYVVLFMLPTITGAANQKYDKDVIAIYTGFGIIVHAVLLTLILYMTRGAREKAESQGKRPIIYGLSDSLMMVVGATLLIPASYYFYSKNGVGLDPDAPPPSDFTLKHREAITAIIFLVCIFVIHGMANKKTLPTSTASSGTTAPTSMFESGAPGTTAPTPGGF